MRLVVDGSVFAWQVRGGISNLYKALLPLLPTLDPNMDVDLMLQGKTLPLGFEALSPFCEQLGALQTDLRPWRFWRHMRRPYNRWRRSRFLRSSRYDVFHPTFYTLGDPAKPSFCFAYDMIAERFHDSYPAALRAQWKMMKSKTFDRASYVLCISESTRQDVIRFYGVDESKCRVVYLGPSLDVASTAVFDTESAGKPYFLFVGDYQVAYKNFTFMLTCLADPRLNDFQDVALRVVSHKRPTEAQLQEYRSILGEDRLLFETDCDDARLAMHYENCVAVIYPSLYEGFGLPVLDALVHGTPVVCARTSSLPEVGGEAAYYFDPGSRDSFVGALREAVSDGRRDELVQLRRAQAGLFSWQATAAGFLEACYECVGG